MTGIPALSLAGLELRDERHFFLLIWAIALARAVGDAATCSTRGRAARCARCKGGLEMAEAFGVERRAAQDRRVRVRGAARVRVRAGSTRTCSASSIPTPFGINQGIEYLFMAVVGGAGSVWGAVVGATVITLLKQVLQDLLPRAARPRRQLRDRRLRHADGAAAAVRARRPVAVDRALAAAVARRAPSPTRRRCRARARAARRARCSTSRARARQFGGLVAVNDLSFAIGARRDRRPHRPERRRQEHDVQR